MRRRVTNFPSETNAQFDFCSNLTPALFAVVGGGMAGDFNRGAPGPVDYGRTDNFGASRTVDYTARNDYDRSATGPMRNGGGAVATTGYGTGYTDVGYDESHW